jgi:acylphosphatase
MTATAKQKSEKQIAVRLLLTGHVQGIGLRPAVARFANELTLTGFVGNTHRGVDIHVEGPARQVDRFVNELRAHLPLATRITSLKREGVIPRGGLQLRDEWRRFDARSRFENLSQLPTVESDQCRSADVLAGRLKPPECLAFGRLCTPESPLGAPMVSSEGACAAYYRYRALDAGNRL